MQKSKIKNQNYCEGQAMITAVIFFVFISFLVITGSFTVAFRESKIAGNALLAKKSYFLSEAGLEDLSYRIAKVKKYDSTEVLSLDGFFATTTVNIVSGNNKEVIASGDVMNAMRKVKTVLTVGEGASFFYGVQIAEGGLVMENTSSITGNVYSNGPVNGTSMNDVYGGAVSAGPSGLVDNIHATGTVYANTISNSLVGGNAYYNNLINTTVYGAKFSGSPNQATSTLPISDEMINDWETDASVSVINSPCPYIINSNITLGPVKINCDIEIKGTGSPVITLSGMVWVVGNIEVENSAIIRLNPSFVNQSVAVIADNPANRLTSSKIEIKNSTQFQDAGTGGYIMLVSQNNSAENGGDEEAITAEQSTSGKVLLYANHGEITLKNTVSLKEVTGYKVKLQNSANIIYETGLSSLLFESGPAGGYSLIDWSEL